MPNLSVHFAQIKSHRYAHSLDCALRFHCSVCVYWCVPPAFLLLLYSLVGLRLQHSSDDSAQPIGTVTNAVGFIDVAHMLAHLSVRSFPAAWRAHSAKASN